MRKQSVIVCCVMLFCCHLCLAQHNRNQIDPTPCFPDILKTTTSLTNNIEFANSWLDVVDEGYFNQHKEEVNATAERTLSWKASGDWQKFDEQRKNYHREQSGATSYKQSFQTVFSGVKERGFDTVDRCLTLLAMKQPGIQYVVSENKDTEVQLEIYWKGLPGVNPTPYVISRSTLANAYRPDARTPSSLVGKGIQVGSDLLFKAKLSDPPESGALFNNGIKLIGDGKYTLLLSREDRTKAVTGSIEGDSFDQVFFSIDPPPIVPPFKTRCTVSAKALKDVNAGFYSVPQGGESFPLNCWHMQPGKAVTITVNGTVEPPQFISVSQGVEVDNYKAGVTYDVVLDLVLRDAGDNEIERLEVLDSTGKNGALHFAKDPRPVNSTFSKIVPPTGSLLVALRAPWSQKWPGRDGPASLSDDFTISIDATDK